MSGSKTLVLSMYPLSSGYREMLENKLGMAPTYLLVSDLRHGGIPNLIRHLVGSHYRRVVVTSEVPEAESLVSAVQLLAAAHKLPRVEIFDHEGTLRRVGLGAVASGALGLVVASADGWRMRRKLDRQAGKSVLRQRRVMKLADGSQRVLYLKNNLWFGLRAGGSVGHVAGVVNGLVELGNAVHFVSPEAPKYLSPAVGASTVPLFKHYALPAVANLFRLQERSVKESLRAATKFKPTLVYQRLSLGDWSGAEVARKLDLPLVVEYNGSELWVARNWGAAMRHSGAMLAAEEAMLRAADLVFTISEALCDELIARGIPPTRIAWYPNCVDTRIYDPDTISGPQQASTRSFMGANDSEFIIMFVGTFGVWHGADILARAAVLLSKDRAWMERNRVRFVFVGDGKSKPDCEALIRSSSAASSHTTFTGLVPQHEAPRFMASADAFAAPHVPNADGSKFFGSPTKLFEYMAMKRPIVASALDQIGSVLEHDVTAVLVQPGSVEGLVGGLRRLVENRPLGARIAAAARSEAIAKYTWVRHVQVMLDSLARTLKA